MKCFCLVYLVELWSICLWDGRKWVSQPMEELWADDPTLVLVQCPAKTRQKSSQHFKHFNISHIKHFNILNITQQFKHFNIQNIKHFNIQTSDKHSTQSKKQINTNNTINKQIKQTTTSKHSNLGNVGGLANQIVEGGKHIQSHRIFALCKSFDESRRNRTPKRSNQIRIGDDGSTQSFRRCSTNLPENWSTKTKPKKKKKNNERMISVFNLPTFIVFFHIVLK